MSNYAGWRAIGTICEFKYSGYILDTDCGRKVTGADKSMVNAK